jgi:hypothetical protein
MCSTRTGNLWSPSAPYAKLILAWSLGFTGALVLRWTRPSSARNDRAMNVEAINIGPSDAIQALASGLRPPMVSHR